MPVVDNVYYTWAKNQSIGSVEYNREGWEVYTYYGSVPSGIYCQYDFFPDEEIGNFTFYGTPSQSGDFTVIATDGSNNVQFHITVTDFYTVTVISNTSGGTVSGGGTYAPNSTATITATPNQGYVFGIWTNGNLNSSFTTTVTGNVKYFANFADAPTLVGSGTQADPYTYISCSSWYAYMKWIWGGGGTIYVQTGAEIEILDEDRCEPWDYWIENVTAGYGLSVTNYNLTGVVSTTGTIYAALLDEEEEFTLNMIAVAPPVAKTNVKVNGSWVKGSVYVNVNGTWKESKKIYVKVNGTWEESV